MLEIADVIVISEQLNNTVKGKRIKQVIAGQSPHKFAFFQGDPNSYNDLLKGKIITEALPNGGQVEIRMEGMNLILGDGVAIQYYENASRLPKKHQLLIEFDDATALCATVQMYGFLLLFREGEFDNPYYLAPKQKPSPLSDEFTFEYFQNLISAAGMEKLSAKALLATEQRIPGLGNGTLQDILFYAGIHPKRKLKTMKEEDREKLYKSIKSTIFEMVNKGGRDTEKDLFGNVGGYQTKLSKKTVDKPCPICGSILLKEAYLGGSIYYCSGCQH